MTTIKKDQNRNTRKVNTIITVDHGTYTENIIVTRENLQEVRNLIENKPWMYSFYGPVDVECTIPA